MYTFAMELETYKVKSLWDVVEHNAIWFFTVSNVASILFAGTFWVIFVVKGLSVLGCGVFLLSSIKRNTDILKNMALFISFIIWAMV